VVPDPATTKPNLAAFDNVYMIKLFFDLEEKYITRTILCFPLGLREYVFGDVFQTENTSNFICGVLGGPCADFGEDFDKGSCEADLEALPAFEVDGYMTSFPVDVAHCTRPLPPHLRDTVPVSPSTPRTRTRMETSSAAFRKTIFSRRRTTMT